MIYRIPKDARCAFVKKVIPKEVLSEDDSMIVYKDGSIAEKY